MAADAVGAILLASITLYAVLGGADFGGGFWDLVAGGDGRGWEPRQLIDESIGPVWEGNHVWLVFDLVIFWTAFPHAFAAVMTRSRFLSGSPLVVSCCAARWGSLSGRRSRVPVSCGLLARRSRSPR